MSRNICIIINKKQGGKHYLEEMIIDTTIPGKTAQWMVTGRNFPKEITNSSKVFFKANGTVKGYFTIKYILPAIKRIIFDKYIPIVQFKLKHFQSAFRYTDTFERFDYELEPNKDEFINALKKQHNNL